MRIAFYAPLKPPGHPTPSGDREMARALIAAIGAHGATVDQVSELRIYDGAGDASRQALLAEQARAEITRLTRQFADDRPALWVTYHSYYKSPDLIGPAVCRALGVPYIQIEATRARSRLTGPWAGFAAAAEASCDAADLILYLTDLDLITLDRDRPPHQRLARLRPFLPTDTLPAPARPASSTTMLSVGMMRAGDKLASYRIIADTLAMLDGDWQLDIAGDGPARDEVAALMAPFGPRVRFLGQLDRRALSAAYAGAALFFWPGVNEAWGRVYLEAQAAGLPVVTQDRPGVRDVLAPGDHPSPEAGAAALARRLRHLLDDPANREAEGRAARAHVASHHLLAMATDTFWTAATPLLEGVA